MKEPALIVIDMLNDFLRSWVPKTRELLEAPEQST
jgi:nicotinamidase-related amidase